jgi:hypothetical protein
METATRNRLILATAFLLAGGFIAYQMFFSLTPPRHADHDHAMAKLDAGGFLWIESFEGKRRNLVGKPGKVLVLHWFDPRSTDSTEQQQAARFAATIAGDDSVELLLVILAPSWEGIEAWARSTGVATDLLYLDENGVTGELIGVRRLPESLIYDSEGLLAHQARGPMDWSGRTLRSRIEAARAGVEEIA